MRWLAKRGTKKWPLPWLRPSKELFFLLLLRSLFVLYGFTNLHTNISQTTLYARLGTVLLYKSVFTTLSLSTGNPCLSFHKVFNVCIDRGVPWGLLEGAKNHPPSLRMLDPQPLPPPKLILCEIYHSILSFGLQQSYHSTLRIRDFKSQGPLCCGRHVSAPPPPTVRVCL